jgi:hypothetical protein
MSHEKIPTEEQIPTGVYLHYKRDDPYEVIGEGLNESTHERYIIYRALYESNDFDTSVFWVRNKKEFLSEVEWEGNSVPRFRKKD